LTDVQNQYPGKTVVTVSAGTNTIAAAMSGRAAGTVYWFSTGTHLWTTTGGISPRAGDIFVGAPGAIIDGGAIYSEGYRGVGGLYHYGRRVRSSNGNNYAFQGNNANVQIRYLTVRNFAACPDSEFVINHNAADNWLIEFCNIYDNSGASVGLGNNIVIRYNRIHHNGCYGFSGYIAPDDGVHNIILDHNEIDSNNQDDIEHVPGGPGGASGGCKFWCCNTVHFSNNYVHDNLNVGIWADTNNNDFLLEGNYFDNNYGQGFFYEISYNCVIRNNTFKRNGLAFSYWIDAGSPGPAIYISEAGATATHAYPLPAWLTNGLCSIQYNSFINNAANIELYESADRFTNSMTNTSTGFYSMDYPDRCTREVCLPNLINTEPTYTQARWPTNDWTIHHNEFYLDTASLSYTIPWTGEVVGPSNNVSGTNLIGANAEYSMYASSYTAWTPYFGADICDILVGAHGKTPGLNNRWYTNKYYGDYKYVLWNQGNFVTKSEWQKLSINPNIGVLPYARDADSVYSTWNGVWP
jgi:parallel beta-helix repeat protein